MRPNFCEALISLPSSNICDYYICKVAYGITKLRDLVKSSHPMVFEDGSEDYRLGDQKIPCLQGCLGELATLEKCCNVIVYVIHTTIVILRSFGLGSKAGVSLS